MVDGSVDLNGVRGLKFDFWGYEKFYLCEFNFMILRDIDMVR